MAEFEGNAVVTTEDLNNIAIDLGDTTFSAFSNNKFGVDKLNEITADIVGKGVLNTGNKCKVILNDGMAYIQTGIIVFESGAKIRITEPIAVSAATGEYIFAYNDVTTGKASIQTSAKYPSSGDYVMLAQCAADGSVVDLRQMSAAKTTLPSDVKNNYEELEITFTATPNIYTETKVTPDLPSCEMICCIELSMKTNDNYPYSLNGVFLSEKDQNVFRKQEGSALWVDVRKEDGFLIFTTYTINSTKNFALKFILA